MNALDIFVYSVVSLPIVAGIAICFLMPKNPLSAPDQRGSPNADV